MTETPTQSRIDWPTVMLVGANAEAPPEYVAALNEDAYSVLHASTAQDASAKMSVAMPHVVILSPGVPMAEHRVVHEVALAVGAMVLVIPDNAHPAVVRAEVEEAMARASKRRWKVPGQHR